MAIDDAESFENPNFSKFVVVYDLRSKSSEPEKNAAEFPLQLTLLNKVTAPRLIGSYGQSLIDLISSSYPVTP